MDFIKDNIWWLLSDVLIAFGSGFLFWVLGIKHGYKKAIKQNMKFGNNSSGIQVGGNINQESGNES